MTMKIISITNRESKSGDYANRQMVIEVDGQRATVTFSSRSWNKGYRNSHRKSRLSVYGKDVESLADNFVNRTRRPYKIYRDAAKPFLEALDLPTKGLVWSQYAYCTCPCSPAFIMPFSIERPYGINPGIGYGTYKPKSSYRVGIVDIDIMIHESLPTVDETIALDPARVEAIERVLVGVA